MVIIWLLILKMIDDKNTSNNQCVIIFAGITWTRLLQSFRDLKWNSLSRKALCNLKDEAISS
jgi:hypothetical protein